MAGLPVTKRFGHFPLDYPSFPQELISRICQRFGIEGILGNKAASGTVIIQELGEEHLATGQPIFYTSADSNIQIAAHEEKFGLDRLYQLCEIANTLHNCAASYVDKVQKKDCTIVYAEKDGKYRICIEVQGNEIIQERIHHNKDPEKEERTALRKWHKKHKLTIQKPQELDEEAAIARLRQPRRARELRQYIPE
jgi:hypothetical protein